MDSELDSINRQLRQLNAKLDLIVQYLSGNDSQSDRPLDSQQAAAYLHLSVSYLYTLVNAGKLEAIQKKKQGRLLFTKQQLDRYLINEQ